MFIQKIESPGFAAGPMFVFFSQVQGVVVFDRNGEKVGRLQDILIEPLGKYARSKALIIKKTKGLGGVFSKIPWESVREVSASGARLDLAFQEIEYDVDVYTGADLSIRRDILDQQVVDMNNQNVIRVNDVHFLKADQDLVVAHVDIGLRGIVRRLGYENFVDLLVRILRPNSSYLQKLRFISWNHIQPLSLNPVSMTIKVDALGKKLAEIPVADLSEIMLDLAPQHRLVIFRTLDPATRSQVFMALEDPKEQKALLEELSEKETVDILNLLPTDEAVDFLSELKKSTASRILSLMESRNARRLSNLLGYSSESAGGLMTTEFIAVPQEATVEEALKIIKEKTPKAETIQNIYIVDAQSHLLGVTFLRRLIVAPGQDPVMKTVLKKTVCIGIEDEVKKIALLMDKYKMYALPVVDPQGVLAGIITIDDIFSRLVTIAWRRSRTRKMT